MVQNNSKWWTSLTTIEIHEAWENERARVYYERLLQLTNSLQHMTTNSFLITIFRFGLQPYLHVATTCVNK
jgi:hypothetical protein